MGNHKVTIRLFVLTVLLVGTLLHAYTPISFANTEEEDSDTEELLDDLFNDDDEEDEEKSEEDKQNEKGKPKKEKKQQRIIEANYKDMLEQWEEEGLSSTNGYQKIIQPVDVAESNEDVNLTNHEDYDGKVIRWEEGTEEIQVTVSVPKEGLYEVAVDYYALPGKIIPIERGIKVNGEFQYYEARRIVLPRLWKDEVETFEQDKLGNEVFPKQDEIHKWQQRSFMDASYLYDRPLQFHLEKGENTITLLNIREPMLMGNILVKSPAQLPTYKEYLANYENGQKVKELLEIEAEHPYYKSDSSIRALPNGEPNVTPNRGNKLSLNAFGGDTWQEGGESVTWKINVEETGFYQLGFKYNQFYNINVPVYRTVKIDGEIPFNSLLRYPFDYTSEWKNETLSDSKGNPYQFFLTKGEHELTLIANPSPYQPVISTIKDVMREVNELSLEIQMATGKSKDAYRDWDIEQQIPDIVPRLKKLAKELQEKYDYLKKLSDKKPDQARNLLISANQLKDIAEEPGEIPVRFDELSQSSGSVTQKLGDLLLMLPNQPLQFDKFYVYAGKDLPDAKASFLQRMNSMALNFFSSFTKDYEKVSSRDEDAIEIWVNRPRQYVMLMQKMANEEFTKKTGIKVTLSLMPSEEKLILANASDKSPDLAMGIAQKLPFELAVRDAVADLSEFPDYEEVIERFSPGALLPFIYDEGTYALPETQEFYVLFYRKDILQALDLEVPDTWEDVRKMLPKLQRFGMNFFVPLAGQGGLKEPNVTVPYIYQNGGELFNEDGMSTAIGSEAALKGFKQMTNLFTVYSLPLQVPNFYSHFRQGDIPIGISDFDNYVKITAAAPELQGWWGIAPYPGVKNEEGEVIRWAPGTGKGVTMFKSSDKKEDAWKFIKWWTSMETQSQFGNLIETIYGTEFRWNTSNVEALSQLPWPQEDLEVIKEQWKWLRDIPHIPGDYMLEREISNAWNEVVFEGENERKAIEDAVITTNREMRKKLEEFGFIKNGEVVKELEVPSIEKIQSKGEASETSYEYRTKGPYPNEDES
ncbi:extracellular solute-binding protein [Pseudalkalibacillus sp. SCS-8]|uniref:extracellular solute-binding protein n=1 Tax=Pseudalkalibacillus nanhaiensis TaxID=3115291 RepID=UPI0032DBE6EC